MKKRTVVLSLLALLYISCGTAPQLSRSVTFKGYDFTAYTAKGFMFTPEQYLQPYEAIGLIELEIIPEVRKIQPTDSSKGWKFQPGEYPVWWIEKIGTDFILNEIYQRASMMGADAIVRLKIETVEKPHGDLMVPVHYVSGFAIKRK